jgi:arginine:ornithine antiporter/lysine permease
MATAADIPVSGNGETAAEQKFSRLALTAMVVGSMVGAGIFSLPGRFGAATGPFGALIAWAIAGGGMLMLAFVFQFLAERKPDLDSGIFAYAQAGFGNYLGFAAAFGFWAGTCVGNTTYFILIKSTLGLFFPIFGDGNTIIAVLCSSVILWSVHFMILRGIKEAAFINTIVTMAKVIPIVVFVVFVARVRFRAVHCKLLGWRAVRRGRNLQPGTQHDAGHRVRVHRGRGRQRLLPLRQEAR